MIITASVTWLVTGKGELAASVAVADTLVKVFAYYGHERLWLRIPFGIPRPPDYEI